MTAAADMVLPLKDEASGLTWLFQMLVYVELGIRLARGETSIYSR